MWQHNHLFPVYLASLSNSLNFFQYISFHAYHIFNSDFCLLFRKGSSLWTGCVCRSGKWWQWLRDFDIACQCTDLPCCITFSAMKAYLFIIFNYCQPAFCLSISPTISFFFLFTFLIVCKSALFVFFLFLLKLCLPLIIQQLW